MNRKTDRVAPAQPNSVPAGSEKEKPPESTFPPQLYTPAQAAEILTVRESWLRRKAGSRAIPCTFLGKHLRFSARDLDSIITDGATTPAPRRGRPRHPRH